jgi:hypothetical protein
VSDDLIESYHCVTAAVEWITGEGAATEAVVKHIKDVYLLMGMPAPTGIAERLDRVSQQVERDE